MFDVPLVNALLHFCSNTLTCDLQGQVNWVSVVQLNASGRRERERERLV